MCRSRSPPLPSLTLGSTARHPVPGIELGHLRVAEGARRAGDHVGMEALLELSVELSVAMN